MKCSHGRPLRTARRIVSPPTPESKKPIGCSFPDATIAGRGMRGNGGGQVIVENPNSPTPHADSAVACQGENSRIAGIATALAVRPYSLVRSQMSLLRLQFP